MICTHCKAKKTREELVKGKRLCRPCKSIYSARLQLEKRQAERPWRYIECDKCDAILLKTDTNKIQCKKCGHKHRRGG